MPRARRSPSNDATRWCWRAVDLGLVIALPLTALCFGGRHDLGRLVYVIGVAVATLGWLGAHANGASGARPTRAYFILAAAMVVAAAQLVALPQSLTSIAAPGIASRLPLWSGGEAAVSLGEWSTVSLAPGETWLGLAMLAAHAALFLVLLQRLADGDQLWRLAQAFGVLSAGMAALGLAQWCFSNGKMLWLYDHPQRDFSAGVQGSFFNANHFAHYVVLGIPAQVMLLLRSSGAVASGAVANDRRSASSRRPSRRPQRPARHPLVAWGWAVLLAISIVAVLLADSRGALVALLVTFATTAVLAWRHNLLRWRLGPLLIAGGAVALGAILIGGQWLFSRTFSLAAALQEGAFAEEAGRQAIWDANVRAFLASPWFGWGAGSHRFVYKLFFDAPSRTEFIYAESGYLQIATETGLAGLAVLAAALTLLAAWFWRLSKPPADKHPGKNHSGVLACCFVPPVVASLVHSVADFVWYVPACLALTLAAAAASLRLVQLQQTLPSPGLPRLTRKARFALPLVASLGVGVAAVVYTGPAAASLDWDRYLRVSRAMRSHSMQPPASEDTAPQRRAETQAYLSEMLTLLRRVVDAHPGHIEARLRIAARQLQAFNLAAQHKPGLIPVLQIRDAALASGFASLDETAGWLQRAFGDDAASLRGAHRHAARVIGLCPLTGEAYLALAELSFLSPPSVRHHATLIDQSVSLRPMDGRVLFNAGRLLSSEGRHEEAIALWRRCCQCPGSHRQALSALLVQAGVPASALLEDMSPGWPMFLVAASVYKTRGSDSDCQTLAVYGEDLAAQHDPSRTDSATSKLWVVVGSLWRRAGNLPAAITATSEADRLNPDAFGIRYSIAQLLIEAGEPDRAEPHIRWCLARRPDLKSLQRALAKSRRKPRLAVAPDPQPQPATASVPSFSTPSNKGQLK